MSQHTSRTSRPRSTAAAPRPFGLPTWSTTLIMLAALAVGMLISMRQQAIGIPFLVAFAAGSVVVTILVEARGLMLTVGQIPLLFGISLPLTAWLVNASLTNAPQKLSATTILTSVYPLAQQFPTLGWVTLGCAIIAGLRIWQFKRTMGSQARNAERERRKAQEADRTNRETASRARRLSNRKQQEVPHEEQVAASQRVTVEELQRRAAVSEEQPPQQQVPHKRTVQRPRPQQRPAEPEQPKRTKAQSPPTMVISPVKASPKAGAHQRPEEDHHGKHERNQRTERPQAPRRPAPAPSTEQRDAQRREAQRQRRQQAMEHPREERTRQQPQRSGSIRRPAADAGTNRAGGHDQQRGHKRTVQTPRVQQPQRSSSRADAHNPHNHSTSGGRYTSRGSEAAQARGQRQRDQQQRERRQQESRQSQQRRQQPRQQPAAHEEQRQPRTVQRRQVRKVQPRRDSSARDNRRNSRHDDLY